MLPFNVFFELVVCHTALFVHPDCARPDPLLRAAKSAGCVQSVGQKLESDLLPLLGRRARRQLEVRRYTLACSAAAKYSLAGERRFFPWTCLSMEGGDRRMTRPACHPLLCCLRRGKFLSRQRSLMPAKSNLIKMAQKFTNHASRMAYVVHRTHLSSTPGDTSAFNHIFVDFITWS
jgi:hypothetical protein